MGLGVEFTDLSAGSAQEPGPDVAAPSVDAFHRQVPGTDAVQPVVRAIEAQAGLDLALDGRLAGLEQDAHQDPPLMAVRGDVSKTATAGAALGDRCGPRLHDQAVGSVPGGAGLRPRARGTGRVRAVSSGSVRELGSPEVRENPSECSSP